jgi:hypothetical protein
MSAKNPKNGQDAEHAANRDFPPDPPPGKEEPVQPCKRKDQKHWIGIRVVDDKGKPVAGVKVKVKLTDGSTVDVTTDKKGQWKTQKVLPAGSCDISFPETLDKEWKEQ